MNKITKLLGIFVLAGLTTLWSCTGDTGPQGPQGPQGIQGINGNDGKDGKDGINGKDGNANVESYQFVAKAGNWVEVEFAEVGTGTTSTYGVNSYENDAISTEKFVMVYHRPNDHQRDALPITNISDTNGSVETVGFQWQNGRVDVKYRMRTQLFGGTTIYAPTNDINFEIVLTTKTIVGAMKDNGINLNDYDAVMDFIKAY